MEVQAQTTLGRSVEATTEAEDAWHVLALNSGSSSLKFGLFAVDQTATVCLLTGAVESIGSPFAKSHVGDDQGPSTLADDEPVVSQGDAVTRIARLLASHRLPPPQAIGHRVVHGGPTLRRHARIDATLLAKLEAATPFAPLHTPTALAVIRSALHCFPGLPQVACFDTTFHAGMPEVARVLALPSALCAEGIHRYGFHGLSCESILHQLADALPRRLLIAHLGNGASVTAVLDGVSIDTSMGLTPSGGLIMGTRSGDLDPGVLIYLLREKKLDAAGLEDLIDHRSGLAGISGIGGDMRALHHSADSNASARLAIQMFCYSAAKELASMTVALGGVDMLVFTGGIGENDATVRAKICSQLNCLGIELDDARNIDSFEAPARLISTSSSQCQVRVLLSQEDEQIARHAWFLR